MQLDGLMPKRRSNCSALQKISVNEFLFLNAVVRQPPFGSEHAPSTKSYFILCC